MGSCLYIKKEIEYSHKCIQVPYEKEKSIKLDKIIDNYLLNSEISYEKSSEYNDFNVGDFLKEVYKQKTIKTQKNEKSDLDIDSITYCSVSDNNTENNLSF